MEAESLQWNHSVGRTLTAEKSPMAEFKRINEFSPLTYQIKFIYFIECYIKLIFLIKVGEHWATKCEKFQASVFYSQGTIRVWKDQPLKKSIFEIDPLKCKFFWCIRTIEIYSGSFIEIDLGFVCAFCNFEVQNLVQKM